MKTNSINQYHNTYKNNTIYTKKSNVLLSNVSFKGNITRSPIMTTTYDAAKKLYTDYEKSLNEVSIKDIKKSALNISTDMQIPIKDVLYTMQKLTQFANLRSVSKIGERLQKDNIATIGDTKGTITLKHRRTNSTIPSPIIKNAIENDIGLHRTLDYLLIKKNISLLNPYKNLNNAVFLDDMKVSQLEELKENDKLAFEAYKKIPNAKYYVISSWDKGITFIDRTKNLETETRKILKETKETNKSIDEVIDAPLLDRIKKLGLKPNIIEIENLPTITGIYHQMAPEKMYRSEMFNLIDVNSDIKLESNNDLKLAGKKETVRYLRKNLKVYTPENLSSAIKRMKPKIDEYVKNRGKTEEDILFVLPDDSKSHYLINYMYAKINDIPNEKFVNTSTLKYNKTLAKDKILILLDDCTLTGNSISTIIDNDLNSNIVNNSNSILFAFVCGNKNAKFKETNKKHRIILDNIKGLNIKTSSDEMNTLVGKSSFGKNKSFCLSFPYMGPDNNNELGTSIALYHNINYRTAKNAFDLDEMGVKGVTTKIEKIFKETDKLVGSEPNITDKKTTIKFKTNKNKLDRILGILGINHQ